MTTESAADLTLLRLTEGVALVESMKADAECVEAIAAAGETIVAALEAGNKLLVFGNGGSAADAVHVAAEFVGRYLIERRPLPAVALVGNPSAVTAIGNDYGFEQVFSRQLIALGSPGDVALGLSTSGASPNVANALAAARERGIKAIAMTGAEGGACGEAADLTIRIPSADTPRIQEGHMLAAHIICEYAELRLAADEA
jgi:D-sedoheptulose 7-phosphate isomerase